MSSSGFSDGVAAISGSVALQREHVAAVLRFHVPHSGQNTSGPELHPHEIVRRPWPGDLHVDQVMPVALVAHGFGEFGPQRALDEISSAEHETGHAFRAQRYDGDGVTPEILRHL